MLSYGKVLIIRLGFPHFTDSYKQISSCPVINTCPVGSLFKPPSLDIETYIKTRLTEAARHRRKRNETIIKKAILIGRLLMEAIPSKG